MGLSPEHLHQEESLKPYSPRLSQDEGSGSLGFLVQFQFHGPLTRVPGPQDPSPPYTNLFFLLGLLIIIACQLRFLAVLLYRSTGWGLLSCHSWLPDHLGNVFPSAVRPVEQERSVAREMAVHVEHA